MWSSTAFDSGQPDPEAFRRFEPPDNEMPVAVPLNVLLARTDALAIAVLGASVYSTGIAFDLVVRLRSSRDEAEFGLDGLIWRHGPRARDEGLLFGVEFADGQRATNLHQGPPAGAGPLLSGRGGSGGQRSIEQGWWLTPVPPVGPLRFVVRCPALGVEETVTEVDVTPLNRASRDVVELWPWTPPSDMAPPEPPDPVVPADSWFSRG
jgi:hypothetical protein